MIEKVLALVLILIYFIWSLTVQSVAPIEELAQQTTSVENENYALKANYSQKKLQKLIIEAGEENGWIMTEFKSNTLIAEKIQNENSLSLSVKFNKSSFSIIPANSELKALITAKLN